ncbi:MAG: Ribulose-phosphate 3-epimerase [Candidatus Anoxychlamydiales bacterium]|nr:Ribulose-phosphate 3-epimerase [Candidatus Anoxychlamydiales bacterium]NGX35276.1 Ribulose-phosphate 3-epimerase [Candidatus Anoxychlamydiales bacterium]
MKEKIKVAPSILSADFANLKDEVIKVEKSLSDAIHLDIMDGHFVPNLTMGPKVVAAINRTTDMFLDVHLMIYNPFDYIEKFVEAGADLITFHFEATEDVEDTINYIKKCGVKAGLAFNPETAFSMATKYLEKCDLVLFMSVHPGFGGKKFIPSVLEKIKLAKNLKEDMSLKYDIQVDGGINLETGSRCKKMGANFLVAGTYLFGEKDMKKAVLDLKNC